MLNRPLFRKIPWLKLEHIVLVKLGLSVALVAAYFVPAPLNIVVGIGANMVWVWKV